MGKTKMKKSKPIIILAVFLIALLFFALHRQYESASKTAHESGFSLSKSVVDLSPFLNDGNGRLNITYEDEFMRGDVEVPFIEGDSFYGALEISNKNCFPSKNLKLPFFAIRSKERIDIQGRPYTSQLEWNGKKLFIKRKVLFDENGYAYVSFSDLEAKMVEVCPDYFSHGWEEFKGPQPPGQSEDFMETPPPNP